MRWIAVLSLAFALVLPAAASAKAKTEVVDAELVFLNKNRPGDPGNCSVVVFAKWKDVPGTTSATAFWYAYDRHEELTAKPPFDDVLEYVATYRVPAGYHWIAIGKGHRDGPTPDDCSGRVEKSKQNYSPEAYVELTVEPTKKCREALKDLRRARKSIRHLRNKTPQSEGVKSAIRRWKVKLAKAQIRKKRHC